VGALSLGSVENLDKSQKSEGTSSDTRHRRDVLSYCEIYTEVMNSTGVAGLTLSGSKRDALLFELISVLIARVILMETAHSDPHLEVSGWQHVLTCLGILLTVGLLIYFS
jgi:hypothetical protein